MDFTTLCKERYSVRKFSDKQIPEEVLNKVLVDGNLAPTAKNNNPVRLLICKSEEAIQKAKECSPCVYGAPAVIIVCVDKDICWNSTDGKRSSDAIDATLVGSQLMLSATENGLGTCFVLLFDPDKTKELFSLPENIKPIFFLPIGYASDDCKPNERHFIRNKVEDITTIL
ncbi:MAG: nitroreductase family protein [Clostridia bacterium]|nr:nitroreductase family protein [Clostridia bacterium]